MISSYCSTKRQLIASASGVIGLFFFRPLSLLAQTSDVTINSLEQRLLQLEAQADNLKISHPGARGVTHALTLSNFYLEALPRLVDLADRSSSSTNSDYSLSVAAQLSNLNALERSPPDAFNESRGAAPAFSQLRESYSILFAKTEIIPQYVNTVRWYCNKLKLYKERYTAVSDQTNVPWYFIGIIHALEASYNFLGHLHNGDPLQARTVHVPKGRPDPWLPPSDWASSATDALTLEGFTKQSDWSIEHVLYMFEKYNGFGYRSRGVNSPYLWSFSNNYSSGKFTADGRFDRQAVSQQCGAAVIIKYLKLQGVI